MPFKIYDKSTMNTVVRAKKGTNVRPTQKPSIQQGKHFDWDAWFKLQNEWNPSEDRERERPIGDHDQATLEDATKDISVNIIRRIVMAGMKPGQCALAADVCRVVAERILSVKYQQGKIQTYGAKEVRMLTGYLVQKAKHGLVMKWDPVICVKINDRLVIKRRQK